VTINNLKELQKVIQACRKLGVQAIKVDNVEFSLGPLPNRKVNSQDLQNSIVKDFPEANIAVPSFNGVSKESTYADETYTQQLQIDTPDELTEDQLLFYSAQGHTDQVSQ
jgi:hypothetical protein